MLHLDSIVYLQIAGGIFCFFSFLVFISAVKKPIASVIDSEPSNFEETMENIETTPIISETVYGENTVHNYFEEMEYQEDINEVEISEESIDETDETDIVVMEEKENRRINFFTKIFNRFTLNNPYHDNFDNDKLSTADNSIQSRYAHILEGNNRSVDIEDNLKYTYTFEIEEDFVDEKMDYLEKEIDIHLDEEVFIDFPHEQRGITMFSKEDISEDEIGDLKELISTIREELNSESKVDLRLLVDDELDSNEVKLKSLIL